MDDQNDYYQVRNPLRRTCEYSASTKAKHARKYVLGEFNEHEA